MANNPFLPAAADDPPWILDGGLATTLEARGFDLDDPLWSARVLVEAPDAVRDAHLGFLTAGADIVATASYQASFAGFEARGMTPDEAAATLERSVHLAVEARDAFWSDPANRVARRRPLVAASVGPYGAFLADGSEYTGRYPVGPDGLRDFHRDRWRIFVESGADLVGCETIPSGPEVDVLLELARAHPQAGIWLSLSCADARHLRDGTRLADVARRAAGVANVWAIGANCTDAEAIGPILRELGRHTDKPLIAYPNGGGTWDAATRSWGTTADAETWLGFVPGWLSLGARILGGCCRIERDRIAALRSWLLAGRFAR